MFTVMVFAAGIIVGVVYEKQLRKYKESIERAAHAAASELKR